MAKLYCFQKKLDELIQSGRNVILQAPTGAGKTRATQFPFLDNWRNNNPDSFPRQCIYAVPMRVLANQFEEEYKQTVAAFSTRFGLVKSVAIQTGARPNDRKFEADLIFTTIDQVLSSFLTIPYSLGLSQANLNAGAVIGSYLVFDEFHLFPVDGEGNGALATTLQMLQMLKGITPFVLMTATFSETMIKRLATILDAEPLIVTGEWLDDIPSQQGKQRTFTRRDQVLDADAVWNDFQAQGRTRAIAICNTVERAQKLGADLFERAKKSDVYIEVLHARFFKQDRDSKETNIRREFGEQEQGQPKHEWKRAILVATQVAEVGLNITCQVLHTEVAPAASVVQRAGRCARFAGESGEIRIYAVPVNEKDGSPDYAPYLDEGQSEVCAKTWQAFDGYEQRVLTFDDELNVVDQVHSEYDTRLLDMLERGDYELRQEIEGAWQSCDRSRAPKLIRSIDNRTILIHPDPKQSTIPDPYAWEGISIRKGRLLRWWGEAQAAGAELDWMVKYPYEPQKIEDSEQENRTRTVYNWRTLRQGDSSSELATVGLLVINPALVKYDNILGFRFAEGDPAFTQPKPKRSEASRGSNRFAYKRETYGEHIQRLFDVYATQLRDQTAFVRLRLAERLNVVDGADSLDQAIRLMIAAHDIGKLNQPWQHWAREWQRQASQLPSAYAKVESRNYMYAHTDYNPDDTAQEKLQKQIERRLGKRPNHAAESVRAAHQLLHAISNGCEPLYKAMITAIVRHHTALAEGRNVAFDAEPGSGTHAYAAKAALVEALRCVNLLETPQLKGKKVEWNFEAGGDICLMIADPQKTNEVLLTLLLSRILRLCDQRALNG